jgi:hypothetical protein
VTLFRPNDRFLTYQLPLNFQKASNWHLELEYRLILRSAVPPKFAQWPKLTPSTQLSKSQEPPSFTPIFFS